MKYYAYVCFKSGKVIYRDYEHTQADMAKKGLNWVQCEDMVTLPYVLVDEKDDAKVKTHLRKSGY